MGYRTYFVYILTNRWKTVLYTGMTNSLERRIWQHKNGAIPGFTKKYNCHYLIYFETYDEVDQAIAREKQLKPWSRVKKKALIARMNPEWKDLAEDWFGDEGGPSTRFARSG
jgi:putative endonuclease